MSDPEHSIEPESTAGSSENGSSNGGLGDAPEQREAIGGYWVPQATAVLPEREDPLPPPSARSVLRRLPSRGPKRTWWKLRTYSKVFFFFGVVLPVVAMVFEITTHF